MTISTGWKKETGPRLEGSRPLDSSKLRALGMANGIWKIPANTKYEKK